jgi:hypothetical protein
MVSLGRDEIMEVSIYYRKTANFCRRLGECPPGVEALGSTKTIIAYQLRRSCNRVSRQLRQPYSLSYPSTRYCRYCRRAPYCQTVGFLSTKSFFDTNTCIHPTYPRAICMLGCCMIASYFWHGLTERARGISQEIGTYLALKR